MPKWVATGTGEVGVHGIGGEGSWDLQARAGVRDPAGAGVIGEGGARHLGENKSQLPLGPGVIGLGGGTRGPTESECGGVGVYGQGADAKIQTMRENDERGNPIAEWLDGPPSPGHGIVGRAGSWDVPEGIGVIGDAAGVVGLAGGRPIPDKMTSNVSGVFGLGLFGVLGQSDSPDGSGAGVSGRHDSGPGVAGFSNSGIGVRGSSSSNDGVYGSSAASGRSGVFGHNTRTNGSGNGVYGSSNSPHGTGVWGEGVQGNGVVGKTQGSDRCGVHGENTAVLEQPTPERGEHHLIEPAPQIGVTRGRGIGVQGVSKHGVGVNGASPFGNGVLGETSASGQSGVYGRNDYQFDARDQAAFQPHERIVRNACGVTGQADDVQGIGVRGMSKHGYGATLQGGRAPLRLLPAETAGAPTSGDHEVGELFVDSNGDLFFCKVKSTPGMPATWVKIATRPA
jgi:hypothetical protein